MLQSKTKIAGLDIGQTSTKLVVLEKSGKNVKILSSAVLHSREEGLVDEAEVVDHLSTWLNQCGAGKVECRIGLPQYMAMTQVSDFPPSANGRLDEMVEYETQQLAGLTDEIFVHDYMMLKPFNELQNPVLLAVCRDSVIQNKLETLAPADIPIEALHMEGQALCESYIQNIPEDEKDKLVLLLDVGSENTTMAMVLNGQVIHVGSFLFGGDFFTEELAKSLDVNEMEAERVKRKSRIDFDSEDCPLRRRAQSFLMELEAALDCCGTYNPKTSDTRISAIYLSGGGARLAGFDEFLHRTYNCTVKYLERPELSTTGDDAGIFNIAYGLALSGMGRKPHEVISLTPEDVAWDALRRRRAALPVASVVLFCLLCLGYIGLRLWMLEIEHKRLSTISARLAKSRNWAMPLHGDRMTMLRYDQMLRPFAAKGNRNIRFVRAVDELGKALQPGDWFYYVADERSYAAKKEEDREPMARFSPAASEVAPKKSLFGPSMVERNVERPLLHVRAGSFQPMRGIVFSGFTPNRRTDRLQNITKTREILMNSGFFETVDTLPWSSSRDLLCRRQWKDFNMPAYRLHCQFSKLEFRAPEGGAK